MTQQKGVTAKLVIGEESTFDTLASTGFVMPFNTCGVKAQQNVNAPATITGSRNPVVPFRGNRSVTGPLVVPMDATAFWYWLQMMFGDPTTTGTGPYVHTFDIGDVQPSYSLEEQFTDLATDIFMQYTGCKINTWSMSLGGDGELVSNFDIVGASETKGASAFDAAATTLSLDRLNNFEVSLTEGGGAISNVTGLDFTVNFGLDTNQNTIGNSGVIGSLPEGLVEVSGNIKTLFEGDTLLAKAIAGTETSIVITIEQSASLKCVIEFNELQYGRVTPIHEGPQGMIVNLPFRPYYDDHADASAIVVELTNNDAHA